MPGGHSDHEISMPSRKVECPELSLIMSKFSVFSIITKNPKIIYILLLAEEVPRVEIGF